MIDCTKCEALCCRLNPLLYKLDIIRIAGFLEISTREFIINYTIHSRYLKRRVVNNRDYCLFVTDNYKCSIYEVRPEQCKAYDCENWTDEDRKRLEELIR